MPEYNDPAIQTFEKALTPLYAGKWAEARKHFERVINESETNDLTARARLFADVCERNEAGEVKLDDPYLEALMAKNDGDLDLAMTILTSGDLTDSDGRIAFLGAIVHALRGENSAAMSKLGQAIELAPENRVRAFHDADFEALHELPEWQAMYEEE